MASYNNEPKDWMAFFTFYLSITFFSLWEASTAHSLSRMVYSKDNFFWNIENRKGEDTDWANYDNFFTIITSGAEFDANNNEEVLNTLESLIAGFENKLNFKTQFSPNKKIKMNELLQGMFNIQKSTDELGISKKFLSGQNPKEKKK